MASSDPRYRSVPERWQPREMDGVVGIQIADFDDEDDDRERSRWLWSSTWCDLVAAR